MRINFKRKNSVQIVLTISGSIFFHACFAKEIVSNTSTDSSCSSSEPYIPCDFPAVIYPSSNPITANKILLGRYLFYDKKLSIDFTVSCAGCHGPNRAFSDVNHFVSMGVHGLLGDRNTPSLTNVSFNNHFTWDGRFSTLEDQALGPLSSRFEMDITDSSNLQTYNIICNNLSTFSKYRNLFRNAFGDSAITIDRIQKAISSFERTIISGNSSYDRYNRGDNSAISTSAVRGLNLFRSDKTSCYRCHSGFNFTDQQFHSNGIQLVYKDSGRANITKNTLDIGKFKTPSLRNVLLTPPYMHDGSYPDLLSVLQNYNAGGKRNSSQDELIRPLHLSAQDITDIIEFLKSLTDSTFINNKDFSNPW
ncbi:MAG: cytochrome c peroxidase [bacterium]